MDTNQQTPPAIERSYDDKIWLGWLAKVIELRPLGNRYLDSPRGEEVIRLCLNYEREDFNWHRSDPETFWLDMQLFVKYKFSNEEILFMMKAQPGGDNFREHAEERNAYAEMKRGLTKLRLICWEREWKKLTT